MSETFWVILVVAVAVVVVLILYRSRLSSFRLQAGSLETQLETRVVKESGAEQGRGPGVTVSGNRLSGKRQSIDVNGNGVAVSDNILKGQDQEIKIGQDGSQGRPSG